MRIVDVSIKQPVFITMLIAAILVIGIVAYSLVSVDLFPDISLPIIAVTTVYPGAGPEEMETQVTKPIEEVLSSLSGVESVRSTSSEGISVVIVQFKLEANPRQAQTDVKDKVSSVRNTLPRDVLEPIIDKFDPSAAPIISFGVVGKRDELSLERLRTIVEDQIKPTIERIDGVASVEIIGGMEREIHVDVDPQKLNSRGISILQVVQALRSENLNLPSGRLQEGQHELLLRTQAEFKRVSDVGTIIVAGPGGVPVHLNEIANVSDGFKEQRAISRLNGKECIIFSVLKQSGKNTVRVAEDVTRRVQKLNQDFQEIEIRLSSDESEFIRDAKNDVLLSLILGAILASIVVFLSFGDLRNTIISVAGLPVCIIGAFAVMYFLGFSMNVVTLLALSLSVGLLIDDAIVVRENIFRHMEELGKDSLTAARDGTSEVGLAVTATTLTVVSVFLPVAFATGIAGKFFREFGITVAAAVLISLFEAFTFAPVLSAYFFRKTRKERATFLGRAMSQATSIYRRINELYRPTLVWSLRHRKSVLAIGTVLFFASLTIIRVIGTGGSPRGERPEFNIVLEYASGTNLSEASALTQQFEKILAEQSEVTDIFAVVGSSGGAVDQAVLHIRLKRGDTSVRAFQDRIRPILNTMPGAKVTYRETSSFSGAAASAFVQLPIQVNVRGDELARLASTAEEVKKRLNVVPGLVDLNTDLKQPRPELQVHVDRERASDLGVSTLQLATVIRTFIAGEVATKLREGEKEFDIRVRLQESTREKADRLLSLYIPTTKGSQATLSQMATIELVNGPTQINRENRNRQILVGGNIAQSRSLGEVMNDVQARLADMKIPEGTTISFGGQAEQMAESFRSLGVSLILAIIFVYMVLASQFGSFVQPFTIMLALPLAVIGALLALLLTNKVFDIMAFIGLIMLMGLVTKNSILLIDYINKGRENGLGRTDAILSAGMKRSRPILMTTLAMVLGMTPVALAFGTSAEFRVSMAVTVIGGLISSTLLTLVVVPVVYTILDDLVEKIKGRRKANRESAEQVGN
jgi:HAE1 family hydrophobic/amphiphilic exporter-1